MGENDCNNVFQRLTDAYQSNKFVQILCLAEEIQFSKITWYIFPICYLVLFVLAARNLVIFWQLVSNFQNFQIFIVKSSNKVYKQYSPRMKSTFCTCYDIFVPKFIVNPIKCLICETKKSMFFVTISTLNYLFELLLWMIIEICLVFIE